MHAMLLCLVVSLVKPLAELFRVGFRNFVKKSELDSVLGERVITPILAAVFTLGYVNSLADHSPAILKQLALSLSASERATALSLL